ncbi:MAG: cytochrome ubiquinol oxidase subunit I, partial [Puniceicoccales bacterium]
MVDVLIAQVVVSVKRRKELAVPLGDPWDGRSLEWSIPAPAPSWNFAVVPTVFSQDAFDAAKCNGTAYQAPAKYEDIHVP